MTELGKPRPMTNTSMMGMSLKSVLSDSRRRTMNLYAGFRFDQEDSKDLKGLD